jgi:TIR domain.
LAFDIFISHASEDKEIVARPIASFLDENTELTVWYDEFTLNPGDSLSEKIDYGLANSRYGLVVISPAFMSKNWPKKELRGLNALNVEGQNKLIPVWHNVAKEEVISFSPTIADVYALNTANGVSSVCDEIIKVVVSVETSIDELIDKAQKLLKDGEFELSVMSASKALRQHLEFIALQRLGPKYFRKKGIKRFSLLQLLDALHSKGGIIPKDSESEIDRKN